MRTATAALAAMVLVGCTLLVSWHRAEVQHGVCAEHGDEVHLERTAADVAAPGHESRLELDDGARVFAGQFALEDGDHHCDLLATSTGVTSAPCTFALAGHIDAAPIAPRPRGAPVVAAAIYRLAPKTSPPA